MMQKVEHSAPYQDTDRYEGVAAGFYHRVDCEVLTHDSEEPVQTVAYRATNETSGVPTSTYADVVIDGARQIGLPDHYLATLETWRNGPPNL